MQRHAFRKSVAEITGRHYSANNPSSQLWIHITGWHSVLKCYERYGPGPLSPAEESQYWAESRIAAELQTCKPSDVPASRDEVRQYFADVHDSLCTSDRADRAMQYLLYTPRDRGFRLWTGSRILAPAARAFVRGLMLADSRPMVALARRLVPHTAEVLASTSRRHRPSSCAPLRRPRRVSNSRSPKPDRPSAAGIRRRS